MSKTSNNRLNKGVALSLIVLVAAVIVFVVILGWPTPEAKGPATYENITIPATFRREKVEHLSMPPAEDVPVGDVWQYTYKTYDSPAKAKTELELIFQKAGFSLDANGVRVGKINFHNNDLTNTDSHDLEITVNQKDKHTEVVITVFGVKN